MPLQETSGNVTTDAYGGGVAAVPNYIEDVFSTYLYTGNGSTQTITNNIDLSTKGGLVWTKQRNAVRSQFFVDTVRGGQKTLVSDATNAQYTYTTPNPLFSFAATGYSVTDDGYSNFNGSGGTYASWTFRKQPKFFDVQTWTTNGFSNQTVNHSLGVVPAFIVYKRMDSTSDWLVLAKNSSGSYYYLYLNRTDASPIAPLNVSATGLTATTFNMNAIQGSAAGENWVAYMFASDAGGFGLTGTDNVISCGSFTCDGSGNATVNLGYEPQWVLMKASSTTSGWQLSDTMRGMSQSQINQLVPNTSAAEGSVSGNYMFPTATGFQLANGWGSASQTFIYIAIRRGPMKVPTSGTSVYYTDTSRSAVSGSTPSWVSGFVTDMAFGKIVGNTANMNIASRLTGTGQLFTSSTAAEGTDATYTWDFMQGWGSAGSASSTFATWMFQRAPSFFDEVCYTGTGVARTVTHNLGVAPEFLIVKKRDAISQWYCYAAPLGNTGDVWLNSTNAATYTNNYWNGTSPTSSVFSLSSLGSINSNGTLYVSYLFATCAGVSKVGSYTGNGSTQTINCGFTGGARFVLIKRTDSTGDWYVYDTARGMTTLTDPYLLLNSTAAETATLGSVTTVSTGFAVNASILAAINTNAASYIFLAIA